MVTLQQRRLAAVFIAALLALGWSYRDTFSTTYQTWQTNGSFSHGLLIVPIAIWLAWRKRADLLLVEWQPCWLGVVATIVCAAAWMLGHGVGVRGVEQFAAFATVPALALAVLGRDAFRVLSFPLFFLMFGVPVGHALVPVLMSLTADLATLALQATGVPIARSGMYISIPSGDFEVARACSGLNYVLTGLALGVLYAHLTYSGWRKWLLAVLAFIVIPIVANGVRVYLTILVSHWTEMRFGPGTEHVMFGRIFFVGVMLAMFWIGQRWRDEAPTTNVALALDGPERVEALPAAAYLPVVLAVLAILAGPIYLGRVTDRVDARIEAETQRLKLPAASSGWSGPAVTGHEWRPGYSGARVERSGTYTDQSGATVDVFVGVYGIGTSGGAEMINYGNTVFRKERVSLVNEDARTVALPDGRQMLVLERPVGDFGGEHLVWYWFMVGDRWLTSPYGVKAEEARALVTGGAVTERIITLSTSMDSDAGHRLEQFVLRHAACVIAGFAFEACGQ